MATRIVEWKKPYTWWKAITVDENKVISLNLRDENNLIIYDAWDDEIYVDLQLPDWIKPVDAFPVWITTWRVLVADDRDVTWTLICAKTTSWDNIKILYGDNNKLYMDNGTWTFRQVYFADEVDAIIQLIWDYLDENLNTKTFRLTNRTDLEMWQDILDRYNNWWNPIIMYSNRCYFLLKKEWSYLRFRSSYFQSSENPNESDTNILVSDLDLNFNEYDEIISIIDISWDSLWLRPYLATNKDYGQNIYQPLYDWSPATKKYVDDAVSTMVWSVYKYKGSVLSYDDLPNDQSVNPPQEWDVWNVEQAHSTAPEFPAGTNVAWTGTVWDPLSWMIDLNSYYTSTQVNTLLAGKQNTLVSWTNIKTINSNSLLGTGDLSLNEFNPWWIATTGYVVTKTANGYEWQAPSDWDVKYSDFEIQTATSWATLSISDLTTEFVPTTDFTMSAGIVKEWMQYIVRIDSWATAYTLTLGTGITNPFGEDLTLTANKMTTIVLFAISNSALEVFNIRTNS